MGKSYSGLENILHFALLYELASNFHHERYDGSGYPRGLKGEEIPLGARLFMADVFDALTSARPYHSAISYGEALKKIREGSGTHFDPDVVNLFENIDPKDWVKIRECYADANESQGKE